ncbi:hypothetical protein H2200_003170 [Cladophialophora chaetospira]|uniref:Uncharacterized protein n=1 Tax=Cladophialophora chaetospira TaxID=386627 RepID=A0AA38XGU6_9EURO|nr:hypothetical protein H2200_003170 [Cladophialophora chaetospira]
MRGVPISKSLGDLGLEPHSRLYNDIKSSISSFTKKTVDVYMASDEELEHAAHKYLNNPNGTPGWVDIPGLRFRWSVDDDRQDIHTAIFRVMQSQQENAIKTLHQKENSCPGCRFHPQRPPSRSVTASPEPPPPAASDTPQVTSDIETLPPERPRASRPTFTGSIITIDDPKDADYSNQGRSRKRKRRSTVSVMQEIEQAGPSRPRGSSSYVQDSVSVGSDTRGIINSPTQDNIQEGPSRPQALTTTDLQDTILIRSSSRASTNTPANQQIQPSQKPESSTARAYRATNPVTMNLRGKRWIFASVEEQARILANVVAQQLEVMESLLAEMGGDKTQLRRRALQCERRIEDYLVERRVELSPR